MKSSGGVGALFLGGLREGVWDLCGGDQRPAFAVSG